MAVVLALAAASLVALSLRLGLLATLLAGYVAVVADIALATWILSPFDGVTKWWLALAQVVLLAVATAVWWAHGRPLVSFAPARTALRSLDAITIAFLAVAGMALAYELTLGLVVPPTNFDSLTYHLARVASWKQMHGIHWIANAPTARMNEFQPLAEQQILFLFVATGTTVVYALPQLCAEVAILAAAYGVARRLGFGVRASAAAAALLATFSIVALEASTAQNDLVAAAFPLIAAYFLLGRLPVEAALAGVAVGLALGAKLTTALVLPVLLWLAWLGGRRVIVSGIGGAVAGFAAFGLWGYVLNLIHTGHVLGHGQGRVEHSVSFSVATMLGTAVHLLLRIFDLGKLPWWLIVELAVFGGLAAVAALWRGRRAGAALVAIPLAAPAIVRAVLAIFSGHDPAYISRDANEDYAAFGPVGALALLGACLFAWRGDRRRLALALALPSFLVFLGAYASYNIWLTRFLIVPAVLVAPLCAFFLRSRLVIAATALVATIVVASTLAHDRTKPLDGVSGRPWTLTQASALGESPARNEGLELASSVRAYAQEVPADACVGAVLDPDEPAYLLWGPDLRHHVEFLSSLEAPTQAQANGLSYVVISTGLNAPVAGQFTAAGWHVEPLGQYWQLAAIVRPLRGCSSVG